MAPQSAGAGAAALSNSVAISKRQRTELQAKYGPLRAADVAAGQPPLPTLAQLRAGAMQAGRQTVRDWWGLVLASVRG